MSENKPFDLRAAINGDLVQMNWIGNGGIYTSKIKYVLMSARRETIDFDVILTLYSAGYPTRVETCNLKAAQSVLCMASEDSALDEQNELDDLDEVIPDARWFNLYSLANPCDYRVDGPYRSEEAADEAAVLGRIGRARKFEFTVKKEELWGAFGDLVMVRERNNGNEE